METPSSIRRVTRSQTSAASQKCNKESSLSSSRSKNSNGGERLALHDITNDSPIVGLAMAGAVPSEKTPSSSAAKSRKVNRAMGTPGSGEDLLRGQVRTLLQRVEEEAEFVNNNGDKISAAGRPPFHVVVSLPGPSPSPVHLLAPTPANTPQLPGLSVTDTAAAMMNGPIQIAEAVKPQEEETDCAINRALMFDSPEKSEASGGSILSSTLSFHGSEVHSYAEKSPEDDSSSAWSIQVNVSEQEEEDDEEVAGYFDDEEEEECEDCDESLFDDLCEGLSRMTVREGLPEFEGKHTRFVYNSDDELEKEEVVKAAKDVSPGVVVLKGLPVPEGKHLRFHGDEEEEWRRGEDSMMHF